MERIGVAFSKEQGPTKKRGEYGIWKGESGGLYARYEGYREQREGGEAQVGLPLAGPNSVHTQVLLKFREEDFAEVRFFTDEELKASVLELPKAAATPEPAAAPKTKALKSTAEEILAWLAERAVEYRRRGGHENTIAAGEVEAAIIGIKNDRPHRWSNIQKRARGEKT